MCNKNCFICDSLTFYECRIHQTPLCKRCKNMYEIMCPICDTKKLDTQIICFRCKLPCFLRYSIKCKHCKKFCCDECMGNNLKCKKCHTSIAIMLHYLRS